MLKSHFNLQKNEEEAEVEEEAVPEAVVEEIVPEDDLEVRVLNKSEVSVRLSWLGKTAEGDGYTYLKATCTGMKLTHIMAITAFRHLQFVDFSNNSLDLNHLQPVTKLPFLVLLQADKNKLTSAVLNKCKYLQVLILNHNQLTYVGDVFQLQMSTLEVGHNEITDMTLLRMPHLRCLDMRNNLIREIPLDLTYPQLDSLYLAFNKIKSLEGIDQLVNLRILHLRGNPIRYLSGFSPQMDKLKYLNLRSCKVGTLKQVKRLRELPNLETLVMKHCPYMGGPEAEDEEDPEIRTEVLAALPKLIRLNKAPFEPEEREEAAELMKQWLEEGEKDEEEEVMEEMDEEQMGEQTEQRPQPQ